MNTHDDAFARTYRIHANRVKRNSDSDVYKNIYKCRIKFFYYLNEFCQNKFNISNPSPGTNLNLLFEHKI